MSDNARLSDILERHQFPSSLARIIHREAIGLRETGSGGMGSRGAGDAVNWV